MFLLPRGKTSRISRKTISIIITVCFFATTVVPSQAMAQGLLGLPAAGTMVSLSPVFTPTILRGIRVYPNNSLKFDFIVDSGDTGLKGIALKNESERLIKYFLAVLTIPEDNLWVNLSPHEEDRIIPDSLALTDMGTDMLAQDYLLKQITASLIYPEDELGKQFWQKIYKKAYEEYGTTNIPVDTFNKVWIMPKHAEVYVKEDRAFVVDSKLKVMLEEDYLALEKSAESRGARDVESKVGHTLASDIVREIVIPALEKEVNTGKNFAQLRQIYNSLILAYWFKNNLKESIINQVYSNQEKIKGVDTKDVSKDIYNQYLKSFKKGVCDYVKIEYDDYARKHIPRKYFSGGVVFGKSVSSSIVMTADPYEMMKEFEENADTTYMATTDFSLFNGLDTKTRLAEDRESDVAEEIFDTRELLATPTNSVNVQGFEDVGNVQLILGLEELENRYAQQFSVLRDIDEMDSSDIQVLLESLSKTFNIIFEQIDKGQSNNSLNLYKEETVQLHQENVDLLNLHLFSLYVQENRKTKKKFSLEVNRAISRLKQNEILNINSSRDVWDTLSYDLEEKRKLFKEITEERNLSRLASYLKFLSNAKLGNSFNKRLPIFQITNIIEESLVVPLKSRAYIRGFVKSVLDGYTPLSISEMPESPSFDSQERAALSLASSCLKSIEEHENAYQDVLDNLFKENDDLSFEKVYQARLDLEDQFESLNKSIQSYLNKDIKKTNLGLILKKYEEDVISMFNIQRDFLLVYSSLLWPRDIVSGEQMKSGKKRNAKLVQAAWDRLERRISKFSAMSAEEIRVKAKSLSFDERMALRNIHHLLSLKSLKEVTQDLREKEYQTLRTKKKSAIDFALEAIKNKETKSNAFNGAMSQKRKLENQIESITNGKDKFLKVIRDVSLQMRNVCRKEILSQSESRIDGKMKDKFKISIYLSLLSEKSDVASSLKQELGIKGEENIAILKDLIRKYTPDSLEGMQENIDDAVNEYLADGLLRAEKRIKDSEKTTTRRRVIVGRAVVALSFVVVMALSIFHGIEMSNEDFGIMLPDTTLAPTPDLPQDTLKNYLKENQSKSEKKEPKSSQKKDGPGEYGQDEGGQGENGQSENGQSDNSGKNQDQSVEKETNAQTKEGRPNEGSPEEGLVEKQGEADGSQDSADGNQPAGGEGSSRGQQNNPDWGEDTIPSSSKLSNQANKNNDFREKYITPFGKFKNSLLVEKFFPDLRILKDMGWDVDYSSGTWRKVNLEGYQPAPGDSVDYILLTPVLKGAFNVPVPDGYEIKGIQVENLKNWALYRNDKNFSYVLKCEKNPKEVKVFYRELENYNKTEDSTKIIRFVDKSGNQILEEKARDTISTYLSENLGSVMSFILSRSKNEQIYYLSEIYKRGHFEDSISGFKDNFEEKFAEAVKEGFGTVTKKDIEEEGFDWDSFTEDLLLPNGWGEQVNDSTVRFTKELGEQLDMAIIAVNLKYRYDSDAAAKFKRILNRHYVDISGNIDLFDMLAYMHYYFDIPQVLTSASHGNGDLFYLISRASVENHQNSFPFDFEIPEELKEDEFFQFAQYFHKLNWRWKVSALSEREKIEKWKERNQDLNNLGVKVEPRTDINSIKLALEQLVDNWGFWYVISIFLSLLSSGAHSTVKRSGILIKKKKNPKKMILEILAKNELLDAAGQGDEPGVGEIFNRILRMGKSLSKKKQKELKQLRESLSPEEEAVLDIMLLVALDVPQDKLWERAVSALLPVFGPLIFLKRRKRRVRDWKNMNTELKEYILSVSPGVKLSEFYQNIKDILDKYGKVKEGKKKVVKGNGKNRIKLEAIRELIDKSLDETVVIRPDKVFYSDTTSDLTVLKEGSSADYLSSRPAGADEWVDAGAIDHKVSARMTKVYVKRRERNSSIPSAILVDLRGIKERGLEKWVEEFARSINVIYPESSKGNQRGKTYQIKNVFFIDGNGEIDSMWKTKKVLEIKRYKLERMIKEKLLEYLNNEQIQQSQGKENVVESLSFYKKGKMKKYRKRAEGALKDPKMLEALEGWRKSLDQIAGLSAMGNIFCVGFGERIYEVKNKIGKTKVFSLEEVKTKEILSGRISSRSSSQIEEKQSKKSQLEAQPASATGGIDFNAENMNVTTRGDEINFNIPIDMQNIDFINFQGFVPIVVDIVPVTNFIGLLGLDDQEVSENPISVAKL